MQALAMSWNVGLFGAPLREGLFGGGASAACVRARSRVLERDQRLHQVEFDCFGTRDASVDDVVKRRSFWLAAEGRFARLGRLGSLRAGSRVIRAHWVRRLIDEHGRARITRSPARPC